MSISVLALFGFAIVIGFLLGLTIYQFINKAQNKAKEKVEKDKTDDTKRQYSDALDSLNITIREVNAETIILNQGLDDRHEQLSKLNEQKQFNSGFFKPQNEQETNFKAPSTEELALNMRKSFSGYPKFNDKDLSLDYLVSFNLQYRAHHVLVAELVAAYFKRIDELLGKYTTSTQETNTQFTI